MEPYILFALLLIGPVEPLPQPRWLVAAIKSGKKLDDFLIEKSARKVRRKRRSER